mmetsp:Transcript_57929/g.65700  ORF Transcript_57929/g.65700 Transcript_57929/m.65700 type:complete len:89 (+) Transcript_57929:68-334(+)
MSRKDSRDVRNENTHFCEYYYSPLVVPHNTQMKYCAGCIILPSNDTDENDSMNDIYACPAWRNLRCLYTRQYVTILVLCVLALREEVR